MVAATGEEDGSAGKDGSADADATELTSLVESLVVVASGGEIVDSSAAGEVIPPYVQSGPSGIEGP